MDKIIEKEISTFVNKTQQDIDRRKFLIATSSLGVATAMLPVAASADYSNSSRLYWSEGSREIADRDKDLHLIGLEEHFATKEILEVNNINLPKGFPRFSLSVDDERISNMDDANMAVQVLSSQAPGHQNIPGKEGVDFARKINNWLAHDVVRKHPSRFNAFAGLPLSSTEASADELERCVKDLKFVGCMTYGSIDGKFLDHPDFEPVLARAEALNAPIYIHPNWASQQAIDLYYGNLGDPALTYALSGAGYGWHQEVTLQCLRMILSGVFDRHPKLQIIIGHMGEGIPFFYWRFEEIIDNIVRGKINKKVTQYLHDNFWITPSAFFRTELLDLVLSTIGEDRMLYATDYPYVSLTDASNWFRAVDLPRATKEKIAHKNWEKLSAEIKH